MSLTKTFDQFEVYQKSIVLVREIFNLMNHSSFEKEYGFKDQIKRAVVSEATILLKALNIIITVNLSGFLVTLKRAVQK